MIREKLLKRLTANMPAKAIDLDGQHYIERYRVLKWGRLEILLHRYLGCDGDRAVHDHPHRWSIGIPLVGGYTEERVTGLCNVSYWLSEYRQIRLWRWNWVPATAFHRIAAVEPGTWTLFIRWSRFKGWGFLRIDRDAVIYEQPLETSGTNSWAETAPKGRDFRVMRGTE